MAKEKRRGVVKNLKIIALYLVYGLVAYLIYDRIAGTKDLIDNITQISLPYVVVGILLYCLLVYTNTFIWYFMMNGTGEKVTLQSQIDVYLKSYMLRYIPGNVVGMLSRAELNKAYGVSRVKSLWAWFLENIVFLTIGACIGSYFLIKNLSLIFNLNNVISSRNDIVIVSSAAVVVLMFVSSYFLLRKSGKVAELFNKYVLKKLIKDGKHEMIKINFAPLAQIVVVLGYIATWALYSLSFLFVVYAVNPSAIAYPLALASVNALAWTIGYIVIITPSGSGVREAAFIAMLPMVNSISGPQGVIIALTMRLVGILGEVLAFSSFEFYLFLKKTYGKEK